MGNKNNQINKKQLNQETNSENLCSHNKH